jgi:Outer membrane protein
VAINREAIRAAGAPLDPVQPPDLDQGGGDDDGGTGFQSWFNWGFGGQISVPLVLGGRNIASLRASRAAERIAARTLDSRRLAAWGEVESALETDAARRTYLEAIAEQADTAREALEAARQRYGEGVGDYLTLLSNLVASQNADLSLVQARRDALGARIALHDALGGAWTRDLAGGAP